MRAAQLRQAEVYCFLYTFIVFGQYCTRGVYKLVFIKCRVPYDAIRSTGISDECTEILNNYEVPLVMNEIWQKLCLLQCFIDSTPAQNLQPQFDNILSFVID